MSRVIVCALPKRGNGCEVSEAAVAHYLPSQDKEKTKSVIRLSANSSLLTFGFNRMWCMGLNLRKEHGATHFSMIHSDIAAPVGWVDTLIDEMERVGGDMISAVVPIKDKRGITSTALDSGDDFSPRRLTMKEIYDREETFTDPLILLNTGLWVCRLDAAWVTKVFFRQTDQVVFNAQGKAFARTNPEDWDFSRQVKMYGGKIFATRKVHLWHERQEFTNSKPWGEWETDQGDRVSSPDPELKPVAGNGGPETDAAR